MDFFSQESLEFQSPKKPEKRENRKNGSKLYAGQVSRHCNLPSHGVPLICHGAGPDLILLKRFLQLFPAGQDPRRKINHSTPVELRTQIPEKLV